MIYGSSYFEKLPEIEAGKTTDFQIKMFYKSESYSIKDLSPIIEIYPLNLAQYIIIKTETITETIHPISYVLVKGNITVRDEIPAGRVSLVYSFSAKDILGNSYRSSWNESTPPIEIKNKNSLAELYQLIEKARQTIEPVTIVINYDDPPLKQFQAVSGLSSYEIKCKEGLELVIKASNSFPACINQQSKQKLLDRGWALDV